MKKTISILLSIFLAFLFVSPVAAEEDTTVVNPRSVIRPLNMSTVQYYSYMDGVGSYSIKYEISGEYTICGTPGVNGYVCDYQITATSGATEYGPDNHGALVTKTTYTTTRNHPYLDVTVTAYVTEYHQGVAHNTTKSATIRINP